MKTITIELTDYDAFPIWLAIDNGKILLCSLKEKDVRDFAKEYEFAHGYEISIFSIDCYS